MANLLDMQITEEGPRNAVVKLTGYLDTSNVSELPAIDLSQAFTNNDPMLLLVGLRVDLIEWSISAGLEVNLSWASANPQSIYLLAGRGRINSTNYGGFVPDRTRAQYIGDINLVTAGFVQATIANFSIVLELVKLYVTNSAGAPN